MSVSVTINGTSYTIPVTGETGWGANVTSWIQAASLHLLQKSGGSFTLTADVDFGASFGLKSAYYKSRSSNVASTGILRLAVGDIISWRDNANAADLELAVNGSDQLTFNGNPIVAATALTASKALQSSAAGLIEASSVTNTELGYVSGVTSAIQTQLDSKITENVAAIVNADVNASAAIDRTKLASGTVDHVLINNGSGVMSSEAQLAISRGGTGQTTATDAFDALAPTTTAGDVIVHNGTDNVRQAIGSDGQVLVVDTAQTNKLKWTTLQQGAKNYITYNNFENNAITGWTEVSATVDVIPSGTPTFGASAAASIALSATNTNPLAGSYSLQMVGTIAQGQGFASDVLTIDREDQAKVLQGSFYYEVASGASNANWSGTSSNTLAVYVYDVTNSTWIQPAGVYNLVQSSGQGFCSFTFQTASSVSQLRVVVWCANTASGSITVNFDDFYLGPQKVVYGAPITDWVSYTPTITHGSGGVTNITHTAKWRRVGDSIELDYNGVFSNASAAFTDFNISLPSGLSIDTAKLASGTSGNIYGLGTVRDVGTNNYTALGRYVSTTTFGVYYEDDSATGVTYLSISNALPFTFNNTDIIGLLVKFPIVGWSSTVQMSSDTDTRVCALQAIRTTDQTITAASSDETVIFDSVTKDTHSTYNNSTGKYTISTSGQYEVSFQLRVEQGGTAAAQVYAAILKNDSSSKYYGLSTLTDLANSKIYVHNATTIMDLVAGDTIKVICDSTTQNVTVKGSANEISYFSVKRISGPSTIAASEKVAMMAIRTTDQTITAASTDETLVCDTAIIDTHGAYSTGTGKYTVPVAGLYRVSHQLRVTMGATAASQFYTAVFKNDSSALYYGLMFWSDLANSKEYTFSNSLLMNLNAGDTLKVIADSGAQNVNVEGSSVNHQTYFMVEKL